MHFKVLVAAVALSVMAGMVPVVSTLSAARADATTSSVFAGSTVLGSWSQMGLRNRTDDAAWQDPGLNNAVYALVKYRGEIYAGGFFDDTGGGGNNEADCTDDATYPLQCIAKWNPATNEWTAVGVGLNDQVDAFLVMNDILYVGGEFDSINGGPGVGACNPWPGITWTSRTSAADNDWQSVVWGGPSGDKKFVAVASSGSASRVMSSPNGITWTLAGFRNRREEVPPPPRRPITDGAWESVAVRGGRSAGFVAVSSNTTNNRVLVSADGTGWEYGSSSFYPNEWRSITWAGNTFVAVGSSGSGKQVMRSQDGWSWSTSTPGTVNRQWRSVARADLGTVDDARDDMVVAVASSGSGDRVMTSVASTSPGNLRCIAAWNGSSWSAVGGGLDGGVVSLDALGSDTLLVAGGFEFAEPTATPYASLPGLVTWSPTGGWTDPGVGGFDAAVYSLLTTGADSAYVGGQFDGDYGDTWGIVRMSGPYDEADSWRPMSTGFSWFDPGSTPNEVPGRVDALARLNGTV